MNLVPSTISRRMFTLGLIGLISCGPPEPAVDRVPIIQSVCNFERTIPNSITAYQDNTNAVIYGDASNSAVSLQTGVWSSIFATRRSISEDSITNVGQQCIPVFVCNYYGQCGYVPQCRQVEYQTTDYTDISHLFGVGRALSQRDAENLAYQNCEAAVDAFVDETGQYVDYSDGRCVRRITQYCG